MAKPLTAGEKIARDLCEMDAPIDNIIEVDPVDVARRIDEAITTLQSKSAALVDALNKLGKRQHYYCDDGWYSCPKAEDGCFDSSQGEGCNCGADKHNAEVEEALAAFKGEK